MNKRYNFQNIRALLTEGFTDSQIRRICYDVPNFRVVYDQLAQGSGKDKIIDYLIEHAERNLQIEFLLTQLKEQNPTRYEKHQPYYTPVASSNAPISLQPRRYFSVGTALYQYISSEARLVANAIIWLLKQRNSDGTWGGDDSLDRFITTNHAVMALMSVGFSPKSSTLLPAINYLVNIDKDKVISFFWRAGTLLNIPDYVQLVRDDMEYLWQFRKRVGVHKDYPVPFFLLKLTRFVQPKPALSFSESDVLKWVIEEWNEQDCWYKRTSITSMALAIIYDIKFKSKAQIISRTKQFLESSFTDIGNGIGCFSGQLVDDCFLVFNLCETDFFTKDDGLLWGMVERTIKWIENQCVDQTYWEGPPPFGGNIGPCIYPTAVSIRSLASYYVRVYPNFISQISSTLVEQEFNNYQKLQIEVSRRTPFWGEIPEQEKTENCFVLMPFQPIKLTEIYQKYIKEPIESQTNMKCIRADDIYKSTEIMRDIWEHMNKAKIVIADLTTKNPNVFYELGMAHVLGKNVILISQTIEDVPFDLRGVRTITYEDRISGYEHLARQVVTYVKTFTEKK